MNSNDLECYFIYLDELRESGITNMFSAAPYLKSSYPELSRNESREVLKLWMDTFSSQNTISERVQEALK